MKETVKFITPIPYAHLPTEKGVDSRGLVIVSLEQLIEVQKRIDKLEQLSKEKEDESV